MKLFSFIRDRSWIVAAANWPEIIFWLEAAAINGAATVYAFKFTFLESPKKLQWQELKTFLKVNDDWC